MIVIIAGTAAGLNAQAARDTGAAANALQLPPLTDLIDSAIKHNPLVDFRKLDIESGVLNVQTEKNFWTRNLGFQADTRYGTFDNFSTSSINQSTNILNTTSRQLNYGVGLFMRIPLGDLLNRKQQIKKSQIEVAQSESMLRVQVEEIRMMVTRQYQEVLLKQKILNIQAGAISNARLNLEMTEKEFRNGVVPVSEYVKVSEIATRSEADYEKAKSEFITSRMILEQMAGFSFNQEKSSTNETH
jgi:outer membrane protein TolC